MAYNAKALSRMGFGAASDAGQENSSSLYMYRTADALADSDGGQVESTGYFNDARSRLHAGDVIIAVGSVGGTPAVDMYVVTASPGTGNVTIARHVDDDDGA